jgi:hypothetical protein
MPVCGHVWMCWGGGAGSLLSLAAWQVGDIQPGDIAHHAAWRLTGRCLLAFYFLGRQRLLSCQGLLHMLVRRSRSAGRQAAASAAIAAACCEAPIG